MWVVISLSVSLDQCRREPVQSLIETVSRGSAARLNVPLTVGRTQTVQSKLVGHLGRTHGVGEILLVGKDEEDRIAELVLVEHSVQLVPRRVDTVAVVGIDDEDEALRVLVVVAPERADLVLTTDVPDGEGDVLVFDRLDVESDGGDGGDDCEMLSVM